MLFLSILLCGGGAAEAGKNSPACENHRIAVLIAARNEENVISRLLDSIHAQKNYPMDHVDIYVAGNCTDDTARVARRRSAIVALSATIRCVMSAKVCCAQ